MVTFQFWCYLIFGFGDLSVMVTFLVWSGLVWSGVVRSGLVWSGLVWSGLVYQAAAHLFVSVIKFFILKTGEKKHRFNVFLLYLPLKEGCHDFQYLTDPV